MKKKMGKMFQVWNFCRNFAPTCEHAHLKHQY